MQQGACPPPLPPRPISINIQRIPPQLPARGSNSAENPGSAAIVQTTQHSYNAAAQETARSSADMEMFNRDTEQDLKMSTASISLNDVMETTLEKNTSEGATNSLEALHLPSIINTQASTPEGSPVHTTPLLRRSSSASSVASSISARSTYPNARPSVQLFGRQSWNYTDEQYAEALEELQALEIVSLS